MTKEEQQGKLFNDVKASCEKLGYTIVSDRSDFINNQSVIKFICPVHGLQEKSATGLKQGKHCALCANETKWIRAVQTRSNNDAVRKKYYQKALDICAEKGYTLASNFEDFKGYKTSIQYICPKHGLHKIRYGNLCSGRGCPECKLDTSRDELSLKPKEVIERVELLGGKILNANEYYNNSCENLIIECPRCHKNIFKTSLKLFCSMAVKYVKIASRRKAMENAL